MIKHFIRSLLCDEFGYTVGDQISSASNIAIMSNILSTIARKKTERSFTERLEIRKELELLVDQLKRDEVICGVNTYEWVLEALVESEAVKIDPERKQGIIIPLQEV